ncbi:hypothetical protein KIN20_020277 [Parelaphostrongylus tenuis]|uniref:Uncharacterized protein n=1 Tax=Parelaphostrongylus tenuis TaxID=148309 RepID=A0AAD5N6B7_PARTN|nr:hypothetical protein KIN20_020277 [Parelaphostrongylus tenuis]
MSHALLSQKQFYIETKIMFLIESTIYVQREKSKISVNMARTSTDPIMISLLTTISTVLGCGVIPAGQDMKENEQFCIIVGNTVTGICIAKMTGQRNKCMEANDATIMPLPTNHTSISGTLMTTNIIMAN